MSRCVLCQTVGAFPVVNRIARHEERQTLVACTRCQLTQQEPMPTAEELRAYYASGRYRATFPSDESPVARYKRAEDDACWLKEQLRFTAGSRIHEVGCGYGDLSAALQRNFRAQVSCWDLDASLREQAPPVDLRADLRPRPPVVLRYIESPRAVDFVLALQVLEHAPDPVMQLAEWRSYLQSTGSVHVQVPTMERMYGGPSYFFQQPHVVNFTPRTLLLSLLLAGLRPTNMGTDGTVLWATARVVEPLSLLMAESHVLQLFPFPDDVPALIRKGVR